MLDKDTLSALMMNDEVMAWVTELAMDSADYVREQTIKYIMNEVPVEKYFDFCELSGIEPNAIETNEDLIAYVRQGSMNELVYFSSISLVAMLEEYQCIQDEILEMMVVG
jgi:hypothetical protein